MRRLSRSASFAVVIIFVFSALAAASLPVSAHVPIYESGGSSMDTALGIPNPSTSYATYAEFPKDLNGIQFYSLTARAGQVQHLELDLPSTESMANFTPVLLLIGPGLTDPDASTDYVLGFYGVVLAQGQGAMSWNYTGPLDEEEFEPFTQVVLLKRQSVNVTLPNDGTYFVAVAKWPFIPDPTDLIKVTIAAKYILVTGTLERFTLVDYILIPYDWIKGHLFWGENPIVFLLPTYLITAGALAFTTYMRRSRPTSSAVGSRRTEQAVFYVALVGGLLMVSGGINQLAFLFGNPLFSLGIGEAVVLMLQAMGIVLGVIALRSSFTFLKPAKWRRLVTSAAIFILALIVGSGFIIGPVLFMGAAVAGFYVFLPKTSSKV